MTDLAVEAARRAWQAEGWGDGGTRTMSDNAIAEVIERIEEDERATRQELSHWACKETRLLGKLEGIRLALSYLREVLS